MTGRRIDLRRVGGLAVGLTFVASLGSALCGIGEPMSVAAGGAVMLANYHLIRMLVSQLIRPQLSKSWTLVAFVGKFLLFFALVAGAIYRLPIEPMSFAVGATQLLFALLVEALVTGEQLEPASEDGASRTTESEHDS